MMTQLLQICFKRFVLIKNIFGQNNYHFDNVSEAGMVIAGHGTFSVQSHINDKDTANKNIKFRVLE